MLAILIVLIGIYLEGDKRLNLETTEALGFRRYIYSDTLSVEFEISTKEVTKAGNSVYD